MSAGPTDANSDVVTATATATAGCPPVRVGRTPVVYLPTVLITVGASVVGAAGVLSLHDVGATLAAIWSTDVELVGFPVLALVGVVMVLERWRPAVPRPLLAPGHRQDALYLGVYVLVAVPLITLLGAGVHAGIRHAAPWLELPALGWSSWLVVPLGLVVTDACNWLAHFVNHEVTPLWRLHAVHHTQEELSILTSFRAHPLVHASFFVCALPVFVLASNGALPAVVLSLYICLGALPHANVGWDYGPVGRLVVSPAYHRLHHAADGEAGANLGVVLTVWDVLARRSVVAERGRAPVATGLIERHIALEQDDPRHLRVLARQLAEPFTMAGRHVVGPASVGRS